MKRLLIMIVLLLVSGCPDQIYLRSPFSTEPPITLYPIWDYDIFFVPQGAVVEWDDIDLNKIGFTKKQIKTMQESGRYDITPEGILLGDRIDVKTNGWFHSNFYTNEIMEAQTE